MRLIIFGGTGGVGSHLVSQALAAGHSVVAFARNPEALPSHPALTVVKGELGDLAAVSKAVEGADAVLSTLGARTNTPNWVSANKAALTGKVMRLPAREEIDANLNEQLIVEYYSR